MAKAIPDAIREATKLVEGVPDDLRQIAFSKAFDAIIGEPQVGGPGSRTNAKPRAKANAKTETGVGGRPTRTALDALDRTKYPDIDHSFSCLGNSLRILQAARDELDIDGLTAPEIHHILNHKFRIKVTKRAVSLALDGAGRYVNRHKEGKVVVFRIMAQGEEFLATPAAARSGTTTTRPPQKASKRKRARTETSSESGKAPAKKNKPGKGQGSMGAKAALNHLFGAGFFKEGRTISDILKHCKHNLGRTYKPNEMSPGLLRLLRMGKLTRAKNNENQYEYQNG